MPQTSHAAAHTGAAFSPLLIEKRGPVDWVTLNRPDSLNALDRTMIDALNEYFDARERDTDTRVIVLSGAGRGFCAGLDLKASAKAIPKLLAVRPMWRQRLPRSGASPPSCSRCGVARR